MIQTLFIPYNPAPHGIRVSAQLSEDFDMALWTAATKRGNRFVSLWQGYSVGGLLSCLLNLMTLYWFVCTLRNTRTVKKESSWNGEISDSESQWMKRTLDQPRILRSGRSQKTVESSTPKRKRGRSAGASVNTPKAKSAKRTEEKTPIQLALQDAKSAFRRCATPAKLVGRVKERETIETFWREHVDAETSGSLYISGISQFTLRSLI